MINKLRFSRIITLLILVVSYRFLLVPYFIGGNFGITLLDPAYTTIFLFFLTTILYFLNIGIIGNGKNSLSKIIICFVILFLMSAVWSYFQYPNEIVGILRSLFDVLLIISFFAFNKYLLVDSEYFFKVLTKFNIVFSAIFLVSAIVFNFFNISLIPQVNQIIKNGSIRYTDIVSICSISAILSIMIIFTNQYPKKIHIINILISLAYIYYAAITRVMFVVLVTTIIFVFIIKRKKITLKKLIIYYVLFLILLLLLYFSRAFDFVSDLVNPVLNGSWIDDGSYFARFGAIEYYIDSFIKNPILGFGVYVGGSGSISRMNMLSSKGIYYFNDVGLIGSLAQYGILFFFLYLFLLKIVSSKMVFKNHVVRYTLGSFLFLTCFTMIMTDAGRIYYLGILLASGYSIDKIGNK